MPIMKATSPTTPVDKLQISSPREAGASLLDSQQLPPHLVSALQYLSDRLVRKRLHISLIVVRKDVQVPERLCSQLSPTSPTQSNSLTTSAARSLFSTASTTITNKLRSVSSRGSLSDSSSSISSSSTNTSHSRETNSPSSPKGPPTTYTSPPSLTSSSAPSSTVSWSTPSTPSTSNPYGISLIHACTLTPKASKILQHYISRAEKKFSIGSGWLAPWPAPECANTNDLIRRSLAQNSVMFSAEGLTLLALDYVYTFKCHLHTYSRSLNAADFSLAVDELRRLVIARQGKRVAKGYLMRAYGWLGLGLAALVDVNEGYKTAYGGGKREGGIEVGNDERRSPPPLKTDFRRSEIRRMGMGGGAAREPVQWESIPARYSVVHEFLAGESAQGVDSSLAEDRGPHRRGATTPNGFEDITPVTRGEWLCLMVGDEWKKPKVAPIITC